MAHKNIDMELSVFFCQQVDKNQDINRRAIEKEYGSQIKFFPVPCSGRIESLHFMRAFEAGSDTVYIIMCPEGACRYKEGNIRARKRLVYTQGLLEEIGIEKDRLKLIQLEAGKSVRIDELVRGLLD